MCGGKASGNVRKATLLLILGHICKVYRTRSTEIENERDWVDNQYVILMIEEQTRLMDEPNKP